MSTGTLRLPLLRSRQLWFLLGMLLLFVVLSVLYTKKALQHRGAFDRWSPQLLELDDGDKLYKHHNYPNPPIMALLLKPLAELPSPAGALTWFYLKVGMTLLALAWVFRLVETPEQPFPAWAKALTVLLSLRLIMSDLSHGNVNLFILFLVVAALYAYHRKWDLAAGGVLALAIACKVTPALFVPYFLWKRSWKTLAGCAAGLVLFLWVVPGLFLGWEQNARQLQSWTQVMVVPYVVKGVVTSEHNNQSLPGLVYRLTTHSPSFSTYVNDVYTPLLYHNVLDLDPAVARWLVKGCMGLFALLVVGTCRTPTAPRAGWRLAAEFSLVVLGMLLFSERTWKHHCVTLVLPFAVLSYCLAASWADRARRWLLIAALAAVVALVTATSTGLFGDIDVKGAEAVSNPGVVDDSFGKLAQVYGAFVWAHLILAGALAWLLRRKDPPAA
jgi:alpha-1,2-mannosyltransferase